MAETPASYFDELWAASADPWDHAGRWYETRKYDLTVAALPRLRYVHAIEPACGTGLLTARLAARADHVSATDRFPGAVAATRARCAGLTNVTIDVGDVRDDPPSGFDLAVISEVLYYLPPDVVVDVLGRWHACCEPGGHMVLVHYRQPVADHVLLGDEVHALAASVVGTPKVALVDDDFRLEVFDAPGR